MRNFARMEPLTADILTGDPSRWRLGLGITPSQSLDAVIWCPSLDGSMSWRHWRLSNPKDNAQKSLEDVVYANPILLTPGLNVDVVISSPRWIPLPSQLARVPQYRRAVMKELWEIHDDVTQPAVWTIGDTGTDVMAVPGDRMLGFIRRTWPTARIIPHMGVLGTYFSRASRLQGNTRKLYCHVSEINNNARIDLLGLSEDGGIALINSWTWKAPTDAVYHILAAFAALELEQDTSEVYIWGRPSEQKTEITTQLRRYVRHVLPALIPSAVYRLGAEAAEAPLELTLLPLVD